ncbi:L-lactate dehydrogenase [Nocardioides sp. KR10-350]|uniref:L-lactate dehydrogenase n=1 Tax=Nocardioides cheoyonin TaxID=3156615 RepID=UPI0032B523EB
MAGSAGSKLSIVGAGAVGSTTAYAALLRGLAETVTLYDVDAARVHAESLDLQHGMQFLQPAQVIGSDDPAVVAGSDVVIVTAGAKQKPGESRLDLAERSVEIMRSLMPKLVAHAPDAVYLMVSNPVDVITYAALQLSGLPRHQVFGSGTVLDSSRLRTLVARHAGVAPQHVHAYIVGEHGDSEIPLWSEASIGGVRLERWRGVSGVAGLDEGIRAEIAKEVVASAYTIVAGKGATNYAIGLASVEIAEAVLRNERRILPVSTLLQGYEGLPDVCLSLPCIVDGRGCSRPVDTEMSAEERAALAASGHAIRAVIERVGLQ